MIQDTTVAVPLAGGDLLASIEVPPATSGVVLFAHGSGSSRLSPRNRAVAGVLNEAGLATVLADLLTQQEEERDRQTGGFRFDIPLLGRRLNAIVDWVGTQPIFDGLPVGLFGASTGAAAALLTAAARPWVAAVVSRGGRPDLAASVLGQLRAPVLLIVGGDDLPVIALNRRAYEALPGEKRLAIIPGATHLFEEPGALDAVAALARDWFLAFFSSPER